KNQGPSTKCHRPKSNGNHDLTLRCSMANRITMNSIVSVSELQARAPRCVRQAERQGAITIARHGRTVAFLISRDRMEAIIESLEIMGNPKAMKAIRAYEAGKVKMKEVSCLDENKS